MPVRRQEEHQGAPQREANSENFEPADGKLWRKGRHRFLQEGHGAHVSDMLHAWKKSPEVQPGHKRYTELEDGGTKGCLPTPQLDANLFCRQS